MVHGVQAGAYDRVLHQVPRKPLICLRPATALVAMLSLRCTHVRQRVHLTFEVCQASALDAHAVCAVYCIRCNPEQNVVLPETKATT
jgi:hypothetical protein